MDLKKIKADVVVVLTNGTKGRVIPYWNCDVAWEKIVSDTVQTALEFTEDCGFGETTFQIFDFRIE